MASTPSSNVHRKRRRSPTAVQNIPKAPRITSPCFRHGAIRKIVLHNFLTFNDVIINPSPQLNVIVGPNGTGKSSVVCAICLGLGGRPNLLGRAKSLKDFVKHGPARDAFIEISLHHLSGNHPTIRREIKKESSSSKWYLNGRDKQENEIIEFIKQFNIQLENKCQFLPQDKVVEFAKLDCYQLLEETERAIGKDDMYELHQQLKSLKTNKQSLEKSLEEHAKELEKLMRANALLERDVARFRTRQDCLKQIKHLEWKKYWLEYQKARDEFESCKKKRKETEKEKRKLHKQCEPLIRQLKEKEAILKSFQDKQEKCCQNVKDAENRVISKHGELEHYHDDQDGLAREYNAKQKEEEKRLKKIEHLKGEIQSFESELAKLPPLNEIQSQIGAINRELEGIRHELKSLQDQQQPLTDEKCQFEQSIAVGKEKLRKIDDVVNQRLSKLNERDHHTYRAICWLNDHKALFKYSVHHPVIVLLQIKNMKYASQIEDFFMSKDAYTFIFESKEDYDKFASEVCDKLNIKVNIGLAPENPLSSYKPSVSEQELGAHGFRHLLIDLVSAPDAVLCFFCKHYYLHNIPIADRCDVDRFVSRHHSIQKFYVGSDVYMAKRSRYGNKTITRSNSIRQCWFLLSSVNEIEKATLIADINDYNSSIANIEHRLISLSKQEKDLRHNDDNARNKRNVLKENVNSRKRIERNMESRRIQMQHLSESPVNLNNELVLYKNALAELFYKKQKCLVKITENLKCYKDVLFIRTCSHFDFIEADLRKKQYDKQKESKTNELKKIEDEFNKVKVKESSALDEAKVKLEQARRKSGFGSPDEIAQSNYRDEFNNLPNDVQTVEDTIHELTTQAELCGGQSNNRENVIGEYENRKKDIEKLQRMVEKDNDGLESHQSKTTQLKERWLGPLEEMMSDIDKRFSLFFKMMECNGQVSLAKHPFDYSKFGVEILVKFRKEEELQILNAQRQSGGERSVSTMMYLMALQDITSCPFRVVDEINQGMDSANERRVFNLIVDTVNQDNTSQYFMLTPKLLQGLKYSDCVTVHTVHNGSELMPFNHWP